MDRRRREAHARRRAVAFLRWARRHGCSAEDAAAYLGLRPSTLCHWERRWRRRDRAPRLRGRPHHFPDRAVRLQLLAHLAAFGPAEPLERLQRLWPDVPRSVLVWLLARFRRLVRRVVRARRPRLHWTRPGTVWAMDFTEPPHPIDGVFRYVLVVRDLGSGQLLLTLPVAHPTSAVVLALLPVLFTWHGPPLVLKCDNGSAFIAAATRDFLRAAGVFALLSPAYTPPYNGSAEASMGPLKTRTGRRAALQGRPEEWTSGDLEYARVEGNARARRWVPGHHSADDLWAPRTPITPADRAAFRSALARELRALRSAPEPPRARSVLLRRALSRALVSEGLLVYRKRRLPLPVLSSKLANIT